jgi:hypothetical protein
MGKMVKVYRCAMSLLGRHHVSLGILLSVLHIGLSCIPVRDSGRADRFYERGLSPLIR